MRPIAYSCRRVGLPDTMQIGRPERRKAVSVKLTEGLINVMNAFIVTLKSGRFMNLKTLEMNNREPAKADLSVGIS